MGKYVCSICGYAVEGQEPPRNCPICKSASVKFEQSEKQVERTWGGEHTVGYLHTQPGDYPADFKDNARAIFESCCTQVGMYKAMARIAIREGYTDIGLYLDKAADEMAFHAGVLCEINGDIVTSSTKENLETRVEALYPFTRWLAHFSKVATLSKMWAYHDKVHEMARDEARHGAAFEAFLRHLQER